jgi:HipA-like protein
MKCVTVYVKGIEAGVLARFRHGGYEFRYTREYRQSTRPSVAFSIPKRKAVHRSQVLFPFSTDFSQKVRRSACSAAP